MFLRIALVVLLSMMTNSLIYSQDLNERFSEANRKYKDSDFRNAIAEYEGIINEGFVSKELFYNLGTSHLQLNQIAEAVLYLERARLIDPSNKNIETNLEIARGKVNSDIIEIPDFILKRIWNSFSGILSSSAWLVVGLLFSLLFLHGLYNWLVGESENIKLKGFTRASFFGLILMVSLLAGFSSGQMNNNQKMAILMKDSALKSGADDRSESLEMMSEGIKLEIEDEIDSWYKVILINKDEGWVKITDVEAI